MHRLLYAFWHQSSQQYTSMIICLQGHILGIPFHEPDRGCSMWTLTNMIWTLPISSRVCHTPNWNTLSRVQRRRLGTTFCISRTNGRVLRLTGLRLATQQWHVLPQWVFFQKIQAIKTLPISPPFRSIWHIHSLSQHICMNCSSTFLELVTPVKQTGLRLWSPWPRSGCRAVWTWPVAKLFCRAQTQGPKDSEDWRVKKNWRYSRKIKDIQGVVQHHHDMPSASRIKH
jgi:hypothetical protein